MYALKQKTRYTLPDKDLPYFGVNDARLIFCHMSLNYTYMGLNKMMGLICYLTQTDRIVRAFSYCKVETSESVSTESFHCACHAQSLLQAVLLT